MKNNNKVLLILFLSIFNAIPNAFSQDLGVTLCFTKAERAAGAEYSYNQSITKSNLSEADWWDNIVEEVSYSGVDYAALVSRGYAPNMLPNSPDAGDPRKIPNLVAAMNRRGLGKAFKLAVFDACASSWTANRNYDNGLGYNTNVLFDCADTANYKYIWDLNLKVAIQNIPDSMRYKINGRAVIIFWSVKTTWMKNIGNGNLKKIVEHIRTKCQETFGFNPYLIVARNWFDVDSQCNNTSVVDAVHNWFTSATNISWTNYLWNGLKTGVVVPGFGFPENTPFIDPNHGQTLINGLDGTVNSGASLTLCEGFTDAAETAAYWRSKDVTYYEYPNQRLNILRRYTKKAYASILKVEAESCDYYSDMTSGNSGGNFRDGDLDVIKSNDVNGGWNVTGTQAGEWMEWKELPLLKNTKFELRYKSTNDASINFKVDEKDLSMISLPSTNGIWSTIDAGNYANTMNSLHTVRLTVVSGTPDINYFNRVENSNLSALNSLEFNENDISIYPNPVQNNLNICLNNNTGKNLELTLFDLSGKIQMRKTICAGNPSNFQMNVSQLNPGLYLLKITSEKQTLTKKINIDR